MTVVLLVDLGFQIVSMLKDRKFNAAMREQVYGTSAWPEAHIGKTRSIAWLHESLQ